MARSFSARLRARSLGSVVDDIIEGVSGGSDPTINVGTPGAIPVKPGSWDKTRSPAEYVIEPGDTMVGIATTYLGNGSRWGEIRDMQTKPAGSSGPNGPYLNRYHNKWFPGSTNPGRPFYPGDVLLMPQEAVERLDAYIAAGQTSQAPPAATNAPGNYPGADPTKPKAPSTGAGAASAAKSYGPYILGGLALAAIGLKAANVI